MAADDAEQVLRAFNKAWRHEVGFPNGSVTVLGQIGAELLEEAGPSQLHTELLWGPGFRKQECFSLRFIPRVLRQLC